MNRTTILLAAFLASLLSGNAEPQKETLNQFSYENLGSDHLTCYVRKDGNDTNTGLKNTATGAFLTIQRAVNELGMQRRNGDCWVYVGDGTYQESVEISGGDWIGNHTLFLVGNVEEPSSCVVDTIGLTGDAVTVQRDISVTVKGFKLLSDRNGLHVRMHAYCEQEQMDYGECGASHIKVSKFSQLSCSADYTISGSSKNHILATENTTVSIKGCHIEFIGSPHFSGAIFNGSYGNTTFVFNTPLLTHSGRVTGKKYLVAANGVMLTTATSPDFLPGDLEGEAFGGGRFIMYTLREDYHTPGGWTSPTGAARRSGFDTSTATTQEVAETLKALIDDLMTKGDLRE